MTAPRVALTSASRTARARARAGLVAELLAIAREHIAKDGAAGLSLRAIARDLGMTSSAVYRYVASRDELLTLLIADSYAAVADVAERADRGEAAAGGDAGARWLAVCRAVRAWAAGHPHEFALVYGSPMPGYRASAETIPAARRMWRVIIGVMDTAISGGALRPATSPFDVADLIRPEVLAIAGGAPGPPFEDSVVRTLALFASMIGTISADLFGHVLGFSHEPDRVFDLVIATAAEGVGLDLPVVRARRIGPGQPR